MIRRFVFILIVTSLLHSVFAIGNSGNGEKMDDEEIVEISPKCAAVLLAGVGGGATLAYTLTPMAFCTAGFCSTGIAGNSFAAAWQSTMPLIAKGSVFSTLQSIAMGAVGTKTALTAAALGGAMGFQFVSDLCGVVDETDPDSSLGQVLNAYETTVTKASQIGGNIKDYYGSSETYAMVSEYVGEATSWASTQWNRFASTASNQVQAVPLRLEIRQLEKKFTDHCIMVEEKCWWTTKFLSIYQLPFQISRTMCPFLDEAKDLYEQLSKKEEELARLLEVSE